jgi:TP901 family phage tail tape measure protein
MVDVQKVTDTTAAGFASLSKDLLAIRGETGASMESIAGAAAGAGRMGIDPTEIADYTETILKMSSAWGMSADAASESIGKIGSVVKPAEMTWTEFGNRMGSTINDLADSMATSEESIVTGMKKVSAQMAMLKPSPDQLSAWAALIGQLQAFGMTAETSGESLKDALNYMMRDDKSGISSMLDMDATEFQEAIREDAIGTVQELAVAISELPIEEQGQALQKFGATGGQMMGMLVGKVDPVTKEIEGLNAALATGAGAWENASSLNEAYAKSQETLNAQIDIFKGKISVAATSIGAVLLPYLTQMMKGVNYITQALIDLGTRGWQGLTGGLDKLDNKVGEVLSGGTETRGLVGSFVGDVTGALSDGLKSAEGQIKIGDEWMKDMADVQAARDAGKLTAQEYLSGLKEVSSAGMKGPTTGLMDSLQEFATTGKLTTDQYKKSLSSVSEIYSQVGDAAADMTGPLTEGFENGTVSAEDYISILDDMATVSEELGDGADEALEPLTQAFEDGTVSAEEYKDIMDDVANAVTSLGSDFDSIAGPIQEAFSQGEISATQYQDAINSISDVHAQLGESTEYVTGPITEMFESGEISADEYITALDGVLSGSKEFGTEFTRQMADLNANAGNMSADEYLAAFNDIITDLGVDIEKELKDVDGEGAGKEAGKSYSEAFMEEFVKGNERAWEIGIDHLATAGMTRPGRASWKDAGYTSGTEWGDGFELALKRERFSSSVKDFNTYLIGTKEYSFNLTDLRKEMISKGVIDVVSHEIYAAQQAIDKYEAETGIKLDIPMSVIMEWVGEDPVAIAEQKLKEAQEGISPYDIWGTPQHWADYSAKYWGEIEDLTILELYNLEDHLRSEGAAGWERAWETILDPDATEAQITGALGVLSPVLEEMGYENGDSYLLGLRERVAESGAELADSIVDSGKYQEYKIEELGETWGNALKDSMINVQEQETLLGIVDALEDAGYEGSAALRQAILDEDWEGLGARIGGLTGDGFTTALNVLGGPALLDGIFRRTAGGDLKEYSLADLLDMSKEERDLIIADYDAWGKNVLIPTISDLVGEMNTDWGEGYTENRKIVEVALWDIIDAYHEFGTAFSKEQAKLVEDLEAGTIGAEKFLDSWLNLGKSANLLNGAMKTAEAACSECQEAMSEFGIWQEENADRLFNQSFIGPTDDYQKFLEQERARGAIHPEPIQLSMVYKADTTEADAALEELKESASETQYMPIEIDDVEAYSAIESINAAASAPVIKPVYIQEYGGGSGSSMPTASASTVSWLNSICPSCTSSPGWGTSDWLPALAEGGIVSRPIIAQVGEVPEAIAPLNVLFPAIQQAVAAAGGGGGVTINSTVIVQGGTVLDEDELQQVLNSRDDQLKNEIARKYLGR